MACRHHGPPEAYSQLLARGAVADAALHRMNAEWQRLLQLELRQHDYIPAQRLLADTHYARSQPLRLLYALFESTGWTLNPPPASARSYCVQAGKRLLRGLLEVWPDNKVIEDLHNYIRADSKKSGSGKRCSTRQQEVAIAAPVLSSRSISHTPQVTLDHWVRNVHKPLLQRRATCHNSARHNMSKQWSYVLGRKTWATTSEVHTRKGVAAWEWLQRGHAKARELAEEQHMPMPLLDSALFSRLLLENLIVQCPDGTLAASMGNGTWAALLYPIDVLASAQDNGLRLLQFRCRDARCWFSHVHDPRDWKVLNFHIEIAAGVVMREHSPPKSLVEAALLRSRELSLEVLSSLVRLYDLGDHSRSLRGIMLRTLCEHVFQDDVETIAQIIDQDSRSGSVAHISTLLRDPLFEAAFEGMEDDEKFEFPDLRKEQVRGRVARHVAQRNVAAQGRKRRRNGQPLRQRRAIAQHEGAPAPAHDEVPQAEALAPTEVADVPASPEIVHIPAPAEAQALGRLPRGTRWGPHFTIAPSFRRGELEAITVTCTLHHMDGGRCNKNDLGPAHECGASDTSHQGVVLSRHRHRRWAWCQAPAHVCVESKTRWTRRLADTGRVRRVGRCLNSMHDRSLHQRRAHWALRCKLWGGL